MDLILEDVHGVNKDRKILKYYTEGFLNEHEYVYQAIAAQKLSFRDLRN